MIHLAEGVQDRATGALVAAVPVATCLLFAALTVDLAVRLAGG